MENQHGKSVFDLDGNLVAMLCYLGNLVCLIGFILSLITIIQDKTNKLARFHAWQSILLTIVPLFFMAVFFVILVVGSIVGARVDGAIGFPIFTMIFFVLSILFYLLAFILGIGIFVGQIIAAIKGFNGELFKIPIIGKMADKYSA